MGKKERVKIECSQKFVTPGTMASWKITYYVGNKGLNEEGGIRVVIPPTATEPQFSEPTAPGYTSIYTSNKSVHLSVSSDISPDLKKLMKDFEEQWKKINPNPPKREIIIRVMGASLRERETIKIIYGDMSKSSPGAKIENHLDTNEFVVTILEDMTGEENFIPLSQSPVIKLLPGTAATMKITGPSQAFRKDLARLTLRVLDARGVDLARDYNDTISFGRSNKKIVIPDNYTFKLKDRSHKTFPVKFMEEGIYRVTVKDRIRQIEATSNPIMVFEKSPDYNIYWGEIHPHTGLSSCGKLSASRNLPEDCYRYAQDVAGLDFAVVMDHGKNQNYHNPNDPHMTDEEWEIIRKTAVRFNNPGKFVTFSGYEWSSEIYGDRSIYFLSDNQPMCRAYEIKEVWDFYRGTETVIVPHHVAVMRPVDWNYHDDEMEPLVEIYSCHGRCEYYQNYPYTPSRQMVPGHSVQDALARGYKLGILSGSDDHSGRAGNYGLTAVLAKSLTREDIFDALKKRRCYGTTNARIILDLRINGYLMGEVGSINQPPTINAKVIGTTKIEKIEIIKDNTVIYIHSGKGDREEFIYNDEKWRGAEAFYYMRVTQEDNEMAWSSPIWLYPKVKI